MSTLFDPSEYEMDAIEGTTFSDLEIDLIDGIVDEAAADPLISAPADCESVHAEAAIDAQAAADQAMAAGDYEAAQYHREVAEQEAWAAGDSSMLHGSDSSELENADFHQDLAREFELQEAELVQSGDYEGAREAADNAALEIQDADYLAGGHDHSGQAELESANLDWAVWHEQVADDMLDAAAFHAENGNVDAMESALDQAETHLEIADTYGDRAEHGSAMADWDPSADVESAAALDYSNGGDIFDSTVSDVAMDSASSEIAMDYSTDSSAFDTSAGSPISDTTADDFSG